MVGKNILPNLIAIIISIFFITLFWWLATSNEPLLPSKEGSFGFLLRSKRRVSDSSKDNKKYVTKLSLIPSSLNTRFSYECKPGSKIIELLREKNHVVVLENDNNSKVITAIDGFRIQSDRSWQYYVNNIKGLQSATEYVCQSNEMITWEFEKI